MGRPDLSIDLVLWPLILCASCPPSLQPRPTPLMKSDAAETADYTHGAPDNQWAETGRCARADVGLIIGAYGLGAKHVQPSRFKYPFESEEWRKGEVLPRAPPPCSLPPPVRLTGRFSSSSPPIWLLGADSDAAFSWHDLPTRFGSSQVLRYHRQPSLRRLLEWLALAAGAEGKDRFAFGGGQRPPFSPFPPRRSNGRSIPPCTHAPIRGGTARAARIEMAGSDHWGCHSATGRSVGRGRLGTKVTAAAALGMRAPAWIDPSKH